MPYDPKDDQLVWKQARVRYPKFVKRAAEDWQIQWEGEDGRKPFPYKDDTGLAHMLRDLGLTMADFESDVAGYKAGDRQAAPRAFGIWPDPYQGNTSEN